MDFAQTARAVFDRAVEEYHRHDDVDFPAPSPFALGSPEAVFFAKCWIDAVQWHLEDPIRDPGIDPAAALALKRRIDRSNQERTDTVEEMDTLFRENTGTWCRSPTRPSTPSRRHGTSTACRSWP